MMDVKRTLFPVSSTGLVPDELKNDSYRMNQQISKREKRLRRGKRTSKRSITIDSLATITMDQQIDAKPRFKAKKLASLKNSVMVHTQASLESNTFDRSRNRKVAIREKSRERQKKVATKASVSKLVSKKTRLTSNRLTRRRTTDKCSENNLFSRTQQLSDRTEGGVLGAISINATANTRPQDSRTRTLKRSNLITQSIFASSIDYSHDKINKSSNVIERRKILERRKRQDNNEESMLLVTTKTSEATHQIPSDELAKENFGTVQQSMEATLTKNQGEKSSKRKKRGRKTITKRNKISNLNAGKQSKDSLSPERISNESQVQATKWSTESNILQDFIKGHQIGRCVSPLDNDYHEVPIPKDVDRVSHSATIATEKVSEHNVPKRSNTNEVPTVIFVSKSETTESSLQTKKVAIARDERGNSNVENEQKRTGRCSQEQEQQEQQHEARSETNNRIMKYPIGTRLDKQFGSHGLFKGTIIAFESVTGYYRVVYEDGDIEELEEHELDKCTMHSTGLSSSANEMGTREQSRITFSNRDNESGHSDDGQYMRKTKKQRKAKKVLKKDQSHEKCAPLRRSRRLSNSTTCKPNESFHSRESTVECDVPKRRSNRRRSQPERLIDGAYAKENKVVSLPTRKCGKGRAKQIGAKSTDSGVSAVTKDDENKPESVVGKNAEGTKEIAREKEYINAINSIMPSGDLQESRNNNFDGNEDDIFNSTPMRELFSKNDSSGHESKNSNAKQKHTKVAQRRSKRKSIEPERYGACPSTSSKSSNGPVKSSLKAKKRTKGNSKSKKRVRISDANEKLVVKTDSPLKDGNIWTETELKALHRAHRTVDPLSYSFWEDVADSVQGKSAMDCREKWFSLAKTPEPKRPKTKTRDKREGFIIDIPNNIDDDIFNSTPMRSVFGIGGNTNGCGTQFQELGDISSMNVGSAIKIQKLGQSDEVLVSQKENVACPYGYKTYLQNMGRSMRQKTNKKKGVKNSIQPSLNVRKKLSEIVNEGDVEMKCKLSPGGTLRVDTYGDSEVEEYYFGDDVEEEELS